jgi:hypothetical protein
VHDPTKKILAWDGQVEGWVRNGSHKRGGNFGERKYFSGLGKAHVSKPVANLGLSSSQPACQGSTTWIVIPR